MATEESTTIDKDEDLLTATVAVSPHPEESLRMAEDNALEAREHANRRSRIFALAGLTYALMFGLFCVIFGIIVTTQVTGIVSVVSGAKHPEVVTELVRFAFTQLNTFAAEAIGYMHSVTQRSTLATRPQTTRVPLRDKHFSIQFHTNLRLLPYCGNWQMTVFHPNGAASKILMAFLLTLTYASVSLIILDISVTREAPDELVIVAILGVPFIVLGICTLLKSSIVLYGFHSTSILTWSPSPLETTYTAVTSGRVTRTEGLCMYNVVDVRLAERVGLSQGTKPPPRKPSSSQPSAWKARSGIKQTVVALWVLVIACGAWGGIVAAVWDTTDLKEDTPGLQSWSFFPNSRSNAVTVPLVFTSELNWFLCFLILVVIQGSLTMTLHSCELIVNVLRDEDVWRKATSEGGTECPDVFKSFSSFWPSIILLAGKTVLHWIFGFCLSLQASLLGNDCTLGTHDNTSTCRSSLALPIVMRPVQIWYLAIALLLFSTCMTFLATRKPRGPQPAAYGHVQTLANLIDDWNPSMKMWWGHKGLQHGASEKDGERIYHAGTDSSPLPSIKPDAFYS